MMGDIDYITCPCGEHHWAAVNKAKRRCRNCLNQHKNKRLCMACGGTHPWENHHIAGRKFMPTVTIRVCLNCHAILTFWQERYYPSLLAMPVTGATQMINWAVGFAAVLWLIHLRHANRMHLAGIFVDDSELQRGIAIFAGVHSVDRR
jgi:hypothetical protein